MPITQVTSENHRELQTIANALAAAKKIVLVAGAGISTNCGIPDFRSEEGLYSLIQAQHNAATSRTPSKPHPAISAPQKTLAPASLPSIPTNIKGKDLFDSTIWNDPTTTSVFYQFIASLRAKIHEDVKSTTSTHRFIRTLRDRRKLVRCYTQNVDGLEAREGLSTDLSLGKGGRSRFVKNSREEPNIMARRVSGGDMDPGCEVVQLHGDIHTLRCTFCRNLSLWNDTEHSPFFLAGRAPLCQLCTTASLNRKDRGKRGTKIGTLRPNIVLYGEEHPSADAIGSITSHDLSIAPDVLLIMGTSLHVHGLKILVREFAKAVHARPRGKGKVIFVNLSKPAESVWKDSIDYWVSMDCDAWVGKVRKCRPDIWNVQGVLDVSSVEKKKLNAGGTSGEKPASKQKPLVKASEDDKENTFPLSRSAPSSPSKHPHPVVLITPKKKKPLRERPSLTLNPLFKPFKPPSRISPKTSRTSAIPTKPPSPPPISTPTPLKPLPTPRIQSNTTSPPFPSNPLPKNPPHTPSNPSAHPTSSPLGSSKRKASLLDTYASAFPSKRIRSVIGIWQDDSPS